MQITGKEVALMEDNRRQGREGEMQRRSDVAMKKVEEEGKKGEWGGSSDDVEERREGREEGMHGSSGVTIKEIEE